MRPTAAGRPAPRAGFTLAEVMVVAVIIGILAAIAVPSYRRSIEQARADLAAANLRSLWAAERLYYLEHRTYTASPADLVTLGALDGEVLSADPSYAYQITSAGDAGFTAEATRAGSAVFTGSLAIDEGGVVIGSIANAGGPAVAPAFR